MLIGASHRLLLQPSDSRTLVSNVTMTMPERSALLPHVIHIFRLRSASQIITIIPRVSGECSGFICFFVLFGPTHPSDRPGSADAGVGWFSDRPAPLFPLETWGLWGGLGECCQGRVVWLGWRTGVAGSDAGFTQRQPLTRPCRGLISSRAEFSRNHLRRNACHN